MICIYPADCTDFSTNGAGTLLPQSCTVTETLNGEYELTLVHPIDEQGKWRRLMEGCILRAPVPAAMTPRVQQKAQTQTGGTDIYRITGGRVNLRSGPGTGYRVLKVYKKGTEVLLQEKTNTSWYEIVCPDGKRGFMSTKYLSFVRSESNVQAAVAEVVESRQLRDQPFRIYRVVPELNQVTVYARHIFYDLLDNMVKSLKPSSSAMGASVVQELAASCESEHPFSFFSDLEATAEEVEYTNVNPVEALLGEDGIVEKYSGELQRDWYDVYVVERVGSDTDIEIREGKNLLGVSYDVDLTNVTTRIMPTGEDKDGELLYLPELYVDSLHIGDYPHPRWMHLAVSEAKEVTSGDDKKSKEQCYTELRAAAKAEYDKGCDLPTVTLNVDFINCADTEEYRDYHLLQNIYLGDAVRVIAPRIGVAVSMRLTQYTYDCLKRKYSDVRSEQVKWLWYPYIAMGKITLLQGDPGDGKSTMMMHLIAELTKGGCAPDGTQFGKPRRVIYQCSEDGIADTIKPRLLASGADCAMTAFLNEEKLGNITLDDERLQQAIIEFRPALLVVDPIQAYIGNCSDLQMAGKARKLTQRLGMWASMYDCAIVLIGHMNKREGQKNLYRGLGSIDLAASARSVLQVERVPEDENIRIVQQIKNNLGPKGNDVMFSITAEAGFQWQACEATPRPYMETQENLVFDTKMDKAAYFLKLYLQNEDMRSREVLYRLKNEGISKRTAELVKESLGIRSYRKMREWFWTMRTKDEMEGKGS